MIYSSHYHSLHSLLVCSLRAALSTKLPLLHRLVVLGEAATGGASCIPFVWFSFLFLLYFDLRGSQIGLWLENLGIFFTGAGNAAPLLHNGNRPPTLSCP